MGKKCALLVVDLQTALLADGPHCGPETLTNVRFLLERCRAQKIEVIYVRHDGGSGDELEYGTPGWEICAEIAPHPGEKVYEKRVNSSFRDTGLSNYLDAKGIKTLILVGMQTEYCIDATCKSAYERGYEVIVPAGTFTTFDNPWLTGEALNAFYTHIWHGRFAQVLPLEQVVEAL